MKKLFAVALALVMGGCAQPPTTPPAAIQAQVQVPPSKPLRVFIRAGKKTHGPGQHDSPRFLEEWKALLAARGAVADGAQAFPTAEQLAATDVLVMYAQDAGDISPEQRAYLEPYLKRGGGVVVIHDAVAGHDAKWFKTIIGGAWEYPRSKFFEGDISLYYLDHTHPITKGVSNFDFDDEMYYDLQLMPEAHVLAGTYQPDARNKHDGRIMPSVYDVAPQMWTYEKDNYRAFVCIPGHNYKSFNLPHFRGVLLRGIAWAGKREVDTLLNKEELASLRYPEGGPTAPEQAGKKIFVPPDFNLNLVASEPMIEKPISMDWDEKGRLWVAETPEYPYRSDRSMAPYDRISILEDTQHSGHYDKQTIFYDKLDLVTSMVLSGSGVIVAQAPDILLLEDPQHTGHASKVTKLYTGFGTRDTHAVVNNLRWGLDGWIYATVGYSKGDIYSKDGRHLGQISDGVIRFKPDGSSIEQVSSKGSNTWGVDVAPDGEIFFTQANGNHIDHVVMPEAILARGRAGEATSYQVIEDHNRSFPMMDWKKQAYVQIDWVGNFTAAAGCCIYDGGAWPQKYYYTHYVAEPTINIVHQDIIKPRGVSYVASKDPERLEKEFVGSTDLWFRPIHQRVGPDGALYILDFYNQAAVHNDTRGPRHDPVSNAAIRPDRDHYFGRIWRVQHKEAAPQSLPKMDPKDPAGLVKALNHPNEWVRATALRLLMEHGKGDVLPQLEALLSDPHASDLAKIHALWAVSDLGLIKQPKGQELLAAAIQSDMPNLAKNALQIAAVAADSSSNLDDKVRSAIISRINDGIPRTRLWAIIAEGSAGLDSAGIRALMQTYENLDDRWSQSAFLGVAAPKPLQFLGMAMDGQEPMVYTNLAAQLARKVANENSASSAQLVILLASKPPSADGLKQIILENLAHELKSKENPQWTAELQSALQILLGSTNANVAIAAMPLVTRWDVSGVMAGEIKTLAGQLAAMLNDPKQSEEQRARVVSSLLSVRKSTETILPAIAKILGSDNSPDLQKRVVGLLGELSGAEIGQVLVDAYPRMTQNIQEADLTQLLKRSEWMLAFLDAVKAGKINLNSLSPVAIGRLRTHSDKEVAARANEVIDAIRGPEMKEKNALIAKFTPMVVEPGDPALGKELFTKNCAICHRFNGQGKDIAPDLTGMGAHGPAELIIHVLDPNREVEPNYYAYSVETKDGEIYDGIIARENKSSLTLRNAAGDTEIKISDIKTRRNTGLSLMPNGFEALGGPVLRDILAYLCAGEANFRVLDLRPAFTANTGRGLWLDEKNTDDSPVFKKYGIVKVEGVPFEIVHPQKSSTGYNIIVLKGGEGLSKTRPQRVEIPNVNAKASRLHFLGGIAAWGYPWGGADRLKNLPVAKVTVHFADGTNEEIILRNGVEIADWIGQHDVPGSQGVNDLMSRGQMRWFTKELKHPGIIQSISLESYDNEVAPAFVAITAGTGAAPPAPKPPPPFEGFKWGPGLHVLIVGGGSSHDFGKWFNQADSTTLAASGKISVNYTENVRDLPEALKDVDVLYQSSNQAMNDPKTRKAIFDFAEAGHGLVLVHPALWYNWNDWPEYNRVLVGGGARSHDKFGEFQVIVKQPEHPVMAGVPPMFNITDELYHSSIDTAGTPVEVLATAKNLTSGKTFPSIWVVKHPKARIVCIALGHDDQAHELAAYKTILLNSVMWAAGK